MTKRGRANRSDRPARWTDIPGLLALALLVPSLILFCATYIVLFVLTYGEVPW